MNTNATGRFIAELRKQKGYTQKELAEKLMVTDKAVSRWETGKGFPDTALLKPLGEILDVSVGELLSGKKNEEARTGEQTDPILLDSFRYSKKMLASLVRVILFLVGIVLVISPLFVASQNCIWIVGVASIATAILFRYMGKPGNVGEEKNRVCYGMAIAILCAALILEILPVGAVMVFATGPDEHITEIFSYFSPLLLGYANITPMLTGLLTIAILLLGTVAAIRFDETSRIRNAVFICSVISFFLSIVPLFLLGAVGMTAASYGVSGVTFLSICLRAVANRKA